MHDEYDHYHYNRNHKKIAQKLRKDMTPWERKLWYNFLRTYPVKFYRQRAIGGYIVDFYCSKAKLIVELDGSQHFTEDAIKYDDNRTHVLEVLGFEMLRFTNEQIDHKFKEVCECIDNCIRNSI